MRNHAIGLAVSTGLVVGLWLPAAVGAQTFDHLKCYKVKDPHKFKVLTDLTPLQDPPFPVEPGCKVKVKGLEFCIPVDKVLVPNSGDAPSAPVTGQALENDFICYNMKCPKPDTPIPPVLVTDQFGPRTLEKFVARRLCAPAVKGQPPTTTTTTTTTTIPSNPCSEDQGGNCLGTCPTPGDTCLYDPANDRCDCRPQSAQCTLDSGSGACAGLCPNSNQVCEDNPSGTPPCICHDLPPCTTAPYPECNGTCPGDRVCQKDPSTTFCYCCGILGSSCSTTPDCCGGFVCVSGTCQ